MSQPSRIKEAQRRELIKSREIKSVQYTVVQYQLCQRYILH